MFVQQKAPGEAQVETGPSLTSFIAWLETMPRDQTYHWPDCEVCACAQYAEAMGLADDWGFAMDSPNTAMWSTLNHLAFIERRRTFGALLERCRAFQAQSPEARHIYFERAAEAEEV